jgi:probable rRNA maturation factor
MSKSTPDKVLAVEVNYLADNKEISRLAVKKLVNAVCKQFGLSKARISITLASDLQIKKLNKRFLGINRITDCLSFDLSDSRSSIKIFEIVVNAALAGREALSRGHSLKAEIALYITHGLLHQLGFDDQKPRQAKKMHKTEDEILQRLGYNRVYEH